MRPTVKTKCMKSWDIAQQSKECSRAKHLLSTLHPDIVNAVSCEGMLQHVKDIFPTGENKNLCFGIAGIYP